jgi:methionyl-tRNA formyltransferase
MNKIKVVFLGSRPLGFFALQELLALENVEVVACVVKKPSENAWWKDDPYYIPGINIVEHHDLANIEFDLGVSINYWKIIEPALILKPSLGFINLHHSYMLSLRGRDMTSHAILNARKNNRWFHGTTLHYTDDGLDTGPIIATDSCEITESDTAWTLFNKVEKLGQNMLNLWLPRLMLGRPPVSYPEELQPLNYKSTETSKKIEDIYVDPLMTYDVVRAFDFNGYYSPVFTELNNKCVFLTTDPKQGGEVLLDIGEGRVVYKFADCID